MGKYDSQMGQPNGTKYDSQMGQPNGTAKYDSQMGQVRLDGT